MDISAIRRSWNGFTEMNEGGSKNYIGTKDNKNPTLHGSG